MVRALSVAKGDRTPATILFHVTVSNRSTAAEGLISLRETEAQFRDAGTTIAVVVPSRHRENKNEDKSYSPASRNDFAVLPRTVSEYAKLQVTTIPANILADTDGIVIAATSGGDLASIQQLIEVAKRGGR